MFSFFFFFISAPSVGILRLVAVHPSGKEGVQTDQPQGRRATSSQRVRLLLSGLHPLGWYVFFFQVLNESYQWISKLEGRSQVER